MSREVLLVETEADRLKALAAKSDPFETGGILLGVVSGDTTWVTSVVEVRPLHLHRSRYELPAGATHALVAEARMRDPRLGYAGDWHSHPDDVGPSVQDVRSLIRLARQAVRRREPCPILLIVRKSADGWLVTAARAGWLSIREAQVVLTGAPAT